MTAPTPPPATGEASEWALKLEARMHLVSRREKAEALDAARALGRSEEREACAAYCLDRADQYDTGSGMWVGIADCAVGIADGTAAEEMRTGATEDLLSRVRRMARK